MYIISENDNLLERLRLLIQSSPLGDNQPSVPGDSVTVNGNKNDSNTAVFIAGSLDERYLCGPGEHFIILVGRDWDKKVQEAIMDVSRHIMSMDNNGRILVIKKDSTNEDQKELQNLVETAHEDWRSEWTFQFEKVRKLGESIARREALERIDRWTSPTPPKYALIDFDDLELPTRIKDYFSISGLMRIQDLSSLEQEKQFSKPPALHWTNYPREAEIQVSFKLTFPAGTLLEKIFRKLTLNSKDCRKWEYSYQWTNGILLREDLIKITVVRINSNTLEVSGRIDKDEVSDEGAQTPFKSVWPYLAKILRVIIDSLEEYPALPYVLNIVFIGDIFFEATKTETASELNARSLDAVQTLGALERVHSVKFKVGDIIYALALTQAFSGFEPHTLSDFWDLYLNLDEHRNAVSPQITTSEIPQGKSDNSMQQHGSQSHLNVHKNRGRRVSFGAIRAIPTPGSPSLARSGSNSAFDSLREAADTGLDSLKLEMPEDQIKSFKMSPCPSGSEDESETTESKHSEVDSADPIAEYVEDIVRKTIDEVLVTD
uniref:Uncharacterized protein n=1 Tax=Panagrolaimus sp. PS1159 TaxID=55785 RepID=A0AC35FYW4_9BILA